jgi:tetratricopeptide (TPR) repeat protein
MTRGARYPRSGAWGEIVARFVPLALVLFVAAPATAAIRRYRMDEVDLESMRAQNPEAAVALERGEALAAAGRLDEGLALFKQTEAALPDHALPKRRDCEAMTAMGRGPEGAHLCFLAAQIQRTNVALRAVARSLVVGPGAPALPRLAQALTIITSERQRAPNRLELSSALCDIAERIGDGVMLEHCANELARIAPNAAETARALSRLDSRCPPGLFWTGWLAIGVALFGTGAHALLRALGGRRRRLPPAAVAAAILGIALFAAPHARAADSPETNAQAVPKPTDWLSSWPVNDADPESSVPSTQKRDKDPLEFGYWLQDVALKGEFASKRGDHAAAVKYYRALAKAVPDRAIAFSKLCDEYEALPDPEKALAACGSALVVEGVKVGDYAHYVRLVLAKPGPVTSKDQDTLAAALVSMRSSNNASRAAADELECEIGTRTSNVQELEECTTALAASAPNDLQTIRYEWTLAMARSDFAGAKVLVDRARKAGASNEETQRMDRVSAAAARRRLWGVVLSAVALALLGGALALLGRHFAARRGTATPQPA